MKIRLSNMDHDLGSLAVKLPNNYYDDDWTYIHKQQKKTRNCVYETLCSCLTAKTRSDRDFEMSLCYTPKEISCLDEI